MDSALPADRGSLESQLAKLKLEVSKCKDKRAKASLSGQIALLQDQLDTLVDNATNADASAANGNESNSGNAKVSKARRKREEKAKVDAERQRAIEKETAEASKNSTRRIERDRLTALLAERNLRLFEIEPNGHCLYASVIHQFTMKRSSSTEIDARLSVAESGQLDVRTFRSACASYMLDHADDFMPFVETDDGEPCDTERFEAYCARIVDEPVWATHLEIGALSQLFKRAIHVIQCEQPNEIVIGEEYEGTGGEALYITFERHAYTLGEHFNSTIPL